jgi:hypothetical protein
VIEAYLILANRIHQELDELARAVNRAERAISAARQKLEDQDLYVDSAALNLHDFFGGLERIFQQIGTTVDGDLPAGHDWHRQLLHQMQRDMPDLRPPVLSTEVTNALDEFRRFRHVVRNIYAFQFDPEQIERLVRQMSVTFAQIQTELLVFTSFLKQVGAD